MSYIDTFIIIHECEYTSDNSAEYSDCENTIKDLALQCLDDLIKSLQNVIVKQNFIFIIKYMEKMKQRISNIIVDEAFSKHYSLYGCAEILNSIHFSDHDKIKNLQYIDTLMKICKKYILIADEDYLEYLINIFDNSNIFLEKFT